MTDLRDRRRGWTRLLPALLLLAIGCGGTDDRPDPPVDPGDTATANAGWMRRLDSAVNCGVAPDGLLARAIEHPDPWIRREAARAIGILRPADAVTLLAPHISRPEDVPVRKAAMTALALSKRGEALPALRAVLAVDPDPALRARAAFAIGRLEGEGIASAAVPVLVEALGDASASVRGAAALAVWHQEDAAAEAIDPLVALLADDDVEVRWRAVYALMRIDDPRTVPPLVPFLMAGDRRERTFAAWGMRQPVDPTRVEALGGLLADPVAAWTARVEALRSLGAIVEAHPDRAQEVRDVLIPHLMRETHPGALEALFEAIAVGAGEIEVPFLTATIERPGPRPAKRAALLALARATGEDSLEILQGLAKEEDPYVRMTVAEALGTVGVGGSAVLATLLRDDDARVRTEAATAIGTIDTPSRFPLLRTAAKDPDLAVRATVASVFAKERPEGWADLLTEVWDASQDPEHWELRGSLLEAFAEHAPDRVEPLARTGLRDPFLGVRVIAARVLGVDPPGPDDAPAPRSLPYARLDDRFAVDRPVNATIVTERGSMVIELNLEEAPLHVAGFVAIAQEGGFDGLLFHRVVPSFVVQGADPRGDGWGDSGYHLVDEIHSRGYVRGTIGMPKLWDHTGGSQIFITHLPTPHLDGRYTIFGQVIEGLDVIDRIEVGDRITEVRIDEASLPGGSSRRETF